jgi:phage replication initiation protein
MRTCSNGSHEIGHTVDTLSKNDGAPAAPPPAGAAADGGTAGAPSHPRGVTRGERLGDTPQWHGGGERMEIRVGRRDQPKFIAVPLPRQDSPAQAAITDWLNATFLFDATPENMSRLHHQIIDHLGPTFGQWDKRKTSKNGYEQCFDIGAGAILGVGGKHTGGTAWLSVPGGGCAQITDWPKVVALLAGLQARITRWDGAIDVYDGQPSINDAVAFYQAGGFNAGGDKPSYRQIGSWLEEDGKGRTFEVGSRDSGKLMRVYEKGKQLGELDNPWVRWELELHNTDREIPLDVLLEPGRYVAGAYPCMAWVQDEASRIETIRKTGQISYEQLCHQLRIAYGRMINVMLKVEGNADKVVEKLRREGVPGRLRLPDIEGGFI